MLNSTVVLVSKSKAVKYLVACRVAPFLCYASAVYTGTPNISKGEGYQATCTVLVVLDTSRPGGRSRTVTLGYMYFMGPSHMYRLHTQYVAPLYSTRPGAT